jgi:hypothetical protein
MTVKMTVVVLDCVWCCIDSQVAISVLENIRIYLYVCVVLIQKNKIVGMQYGLLSFYSPDIG